MSRSIFFVIFYLWAGVAFAEGVQATNNMTGDLNTNTMNSTVDSNNIANSTTNNNYGAGAGKSAPPMSAIAPSYMSSGADTCLVGEGGGIQTGVFGVSSGSYEQDPECNRRRNAKVLNDLGMKVAAIGLMCEDIKVWEAMFSSQSPCPFVINGRLVVGKQAYLMMKQNPEFLIPNYKDKKDYYDIVLGIGANENEETSTGEYRSISERYRTSVRDYN